MMPIPYPLLLAGHVLAMASFLAGLFVNAATLPGGAGRSAAEVARARALNRFVTTPALVLVWLFGLGLAAEGQWFAAPWLHAKILLVVALSGVHGMLSGRLRRSGTPAARATTYRPLLAIAALAGAIVVLVVTKPG